MTTDIRKANWKLYFGFPALIFLSCFLITLSPAFKVNQPVVSFAIAFDLIITAPLVYLFFIRKTAISKTTIFRMMVIGIVATGFIIGADSPVTAILKFWLAPIVETIVIFLAVMKFRQFRKEAKNNRGENTDFLICTRLILGKVFGSQKVANIMASEIAVVYYAFAKRQRTISNEQFTSYKNTAIIIMLYTFMFLLSVETGIVHLLVAMKSDLWAWVLTALSLYTCLQLFAHIRAIKIRVTTLNATGIDLRMGLASDAFIEYENITSIDRFTKDLEGNNIKIALLDGLEEHNIRIQLKKEVEVTKMFGIKKRSNVVLMYIDEPELFLEKVKNKGR